MGVFSAREIALSLPIESSLLELVLKFPFNVLLVMTVVLIVGIFRIFMRKPARTNPTIIDVERQPAQGAEEVVPKIARGTTLKGPMQIVEEMPRSFKSGKEGVVELYTWFYRFAQGRFGGIGDNMTPREFMRVVSGRIPSQGGLPLEYLVICFEIVIYSKKELTKEIQLKCLKSVEVLKELIEGGDLRKSDDDKELDEPSSEFVTHNVQVPET
jgi:hypothetical protein